MVFFFRSKKFTLYIEDPSGYPFQSFFFVKCTKKKKDFHFYPGYKVNDFFFKEMNKSIETYVYLNIEENIFKLKKRK
ncbi:hypothetical protein SAMN05443292_2788 [Halpernia frigidisoli]|uniref:Uncharacterized protein n=1 Tax=Halpernia frigidisoli TaxID=1125876 RepID=A0A1I3IUK1_9FLAO|nr:hypothetical protein SAMN05443292_2788 [Halpernia frigidisoli]